MSISGEASSGVYREATLDCRKGEYDRLQMPMSQWPLPPLHTHPNVGWHTFFDGFFPNSLSVSSANRIGASSTACGEWVVQFVSVQGEREDVQVHHQMHL